MVLICTADFGEFCIVFKMIKKRNMFFLNETSREIFSYIFYIN